MLAEYLATGILNADGITNVFDYESGKESGHFHSTFITS
jgi:hypothetical protein